MHKTLDGQLDRLLDGLDDPFYAVDSRDWQLVQPRLKVFEEHGARILSIEKIRTHVQLERAIMAVRFSDEFVGTQFHPEADPIGMKAHFNREDQRRPVEFLSEPSGDPARRAARAAWPDRLQGRLRVRRLRRLQHHVDDRLVCSCLMLAVEAEGHGWRPSRAWPRATNCIRCSRSFWKWPPFSAASVRRACWSLRTRCCAEFEAERGGGALLARRQSLPLHRLRQDRAGGDGKPAHEMREAADGYTNLMERQLLLRRHDASKFAARIPGKSYNNDTEVEAVPLRDLPSGGLNSSANDMTHFMQMVFADGRYNGKQIVRPESLREMFKVQNAGVAMDFDGQDGGWAGCSAAWMCPMRASWRTMAARR